MCKRVIWWCLTLACAALILGFSLQSVKTSLKISGSLTDIVLEQDTDYKESSPTSQKVKNDKVHDTLRSGAHIALFAVLSFCASRLADTYTKKWWIAISLPSCFVFAILDECAQYLRHAGRKFELADIGKDWLGVLIGVAVAAVVVLGWNVYHRRKQEETNHGVSGSGVG